MLKTLVPIVLLIMTGVLLKKIKFVKDEAIGGIKKIATNVFLPVVIFNALVTTDLNMDSLFLVVLGMSVLLIGFGLGFVLKKLNKKEYRKYIPFTTTLFECGMIGYALTEALVGKDNLFYIATIDIAGVIFGFTIWVTLLQRAGDDVTNDNFKKNNILIDMVKSPTLIAAILGMIVSFTGLGRVLLESNIGPVYENTADMFSAPLTPVILICLGYGLKFSKENLIDAFIMAGQRIMAVAVAVVISLLIFGSFLEFTPELKISMIMYYALPPSMLVSVYTKGEKSQGVMSCMLSMYIVLSLIIFSILLWRVKSA